MMAAQACLLIFGIIVLTRTSINKELSLHLTISGYENCIFHVAKYDLDTDLYSRDTIDGMLT